ncbi:LOW QUALITY PROTEIN: uncharacterized protein LOC102656554 [Apis mellifera]|uniref:NADH:ubiquinone reductase (H(+)-translocating) n=1 Tax=Apis mellifera TaxID=7460 RepID=A0A7M7MW40_APIME|nr:LOW QUALITY PROTEIN: uncharacterized protein LOC102656554 [Apis mellifera]|eukprot:XP_026301416.1 LOW QUALITY PROTEIN: uncharacterized protein LOC102656554 [Apis mellifera]
MASSATSVNCCRVRSEGLGENYFQMSAIWNEDKNASVHSHPNFELDLKKVIVYSTLRQLGLIIRILSIGSTELVFLHLFIHTIFHLIFTYVDRYIHYIYRNQDIRLYYGMYYIYPLKRIIIIFSILKLSGLCGFPFLIGDYSKDLIIENIYYICFSLFIIYLESKSMISTLNFIISNVIRLKFRQTVLFLIYV